MNKYFIFLLLLLLALLIGCGESSLKEQLKVEAPNSSSSISNENTIQSVRGYILSLRILTNDIERPGFIGFKNKVNVIAPRSEIIINMNKEEGEFVAQNSLLFSLDTTSLEIEAEQAQASIRQAEKEVEIKKAQYQNALLSVEKNILSLERQKKEIDMERINLKNTGRILNNKKILYESKGIPLENYLEFQLQYINAEGNLEIKEKDFSINSIGYRDQDLINNGYSIPTDKSKKNDLFKKINTLVEESALNGEIAKLENARSQLKSIERIISLSKVKAPISGYIASKLFESGEKADQAKPVYVLVNLEQVFIEADIPESFYYEFDIGDKITFTVDSSFLSQQKKLISSVYSINPIINPQTGVFQIKGLYRNSKDNFLRPGMFVKIYLQSSEGERGLFIRQEDFIDIKYSSDLGFSTGTVFTIRNQRLQKKQVLLGRKFKNFYKVTEGLSVGDVVVIYESQILQENQPVTLVTENENTI